MSLLKRLFGKSVDFTAMLEQGAVILDVRTPAEYQQGHAVGSINIPLDRLDAEKKRILKLDRPIIACCASGIRSGVAASKLRSWKLEAHNAGSWNKVVRYQNS